MNKSDKFARLAQYFLIVASGFILVACITTTSGPPKSKEDSGDAAGINFQLAIKYYRNGKYDLARDRLLLSTELDPKRPVVWSTLAMTYEQLGNLRLAEEAHSEALKTGPRNFDVLNGYAVFLCRQRRFDDAEEQFESSIKVSTNDNPELMMTNAGVCMTQKPDYAKAESFFRRALDRRPVHGEALLQMALLKHQTGDDLIGRAFLQRYMEYYPADQGVLYLCVLIEGKLGDSKARTDCENELLRDFPDSPEAKLVLDD